jgi:anti-sigma factor RsiW
VSDVTAHLSTEEMADLCALADGTLPVDRRAEVEARVAASPELRELLDRQRQAVMATQALSSEDVPEPLRAAVEADRRARGSRRPRGRGFVPKLALAGAAVAAAAVVAAVVLSGGPGAPTVADAAQLGTQPATAPAPPPAGTAGTRLALGVQGVAFPDFARSYGWQAVGVHRGRIHGRDAVVVVYEKGSRRLAYVIVAGAGLSRPAGAESTSVKGVEYQTLELDGRLAITWQRGGHTCVLIGQAPRSELLTLASWPLTPTR